jgi:uncharacterized coiled-coil protein SlyX
MGKDRTVLGSANRSTWVSKFWPAGHGRFEEMCALAITGQLGGAQMCELDEHIAHCERCRKYLESVAQVSVQVMPLLAEKHAPDRKLAPPVGMRERFLSRLATEPTGGVTGKPLRSPSLMDRAVQERPNFKFIVEEKQPRQPTPKTILSPALWRPLAISAACLIVVTGAFYAGRRTTVQPPPQVTVVHRTAPPAATVPTTPAEPDRVGQLESQKSELETKLTVMKRELATAQNERESLSKQLASAKEKLAAITTQAANRPMQDSPVVTQQTSEQVSTLQAQVGRLNQRLAETEVNLGIQKQTSDELSAKLDATAFDLQRERDLKSATSQMGDLVASRNLHIVDVYDADPNGKRARSFGRVFYVEGQSLVFYAYDLDDPGRLRANVVFHVWGGKAGVKEVTHSLGILHRDDTSQNRWAMTFDDPKVLTEINSVFVTAESASKHYDQPHGKKVLYAYFGSPANHP